jgi:hypothetical protein
MKMLCKKVCQEKRYCCTLNNSCGKIFEWGAGWLGNEVRFVMEGKRNTAMLLDGTFYMYMLKEDP